MKTRISRWGNSLGLRIPKSFAEQVELREGSAVDLSLAGGQLVVRPLPPTYDLSELLARVEPENLHEEADFGEPVGRESW